MKRHMPGLHLEGSRGDEVPQGLFLVRVDRAYYRWHPQKPFFVLSFEIAEPRDLASRKISGRLYAREGTVAAELVPSRFWIRPGFARAGRGGRKSSARPNRSPPNHDRKSLLVALIQNLRAFAPSSEWEFISKDARDGVVTGDSDDLQPYADQPISSLSSQLSLSLSRRMAGKRHARSDGFRPLL